MFDDLAMVHGPGMSVPEISAGITWRTCLRSIWIGSATDIGAADLDQCEFYRGSAAYEFLVEVVCGLRSPLIGETEVMGQFKEFAARVSGEAEWARPLFQSILTDAKMVRRTHLKDLGSQSYGSLTRKVLKNADAVHVLGSGQLTEEILPWVKNFRRVEVFCRNDARRTELAKLFPEAKFAGLEVSDAAGENHPRNALIIAAPLTASEIGEWLARHEHAFDMLVDLRGEAVADPLPMISGGAVIVQLSDFFSSIESNQGRIRVRVESALRLIHELSTTREKAQEYRPFGWEDLCS